MDIHLARLVFGHLLIVGRDHLVTYYLVLKQWIDLLRRFVAHYHYERYK